MNQRTILIGGAFALIAAVMVGYNVLSSQTAAPASGPPLVDVTVPDLSEAALAGQADFQQHCAACHGDNAAGQDGVAPPLIHPIYEPGHHSDGAFFFAAENGAQAHHWQFGDMPPVDGVNRDEVGRIVTYIRELQRANGID